MAPFAYCSSLAAVTLPDSLASIGDGAFAYYCRRPSPPSRAASTQSGGYALEGCSSLTEVSCRGQPRLHRRLFGCKSLTTVSLPLPDGLTTIGDGAFCGCPLDAESLWWDETAAAAGGRAARRDWPR
ncbi:hypothetical protein EMIHUDRAFT_212731 [Emiliania huxleyi CCMP1516]|uniref:Uncharacterized protein n=2 Tax=Emiliania huxleyi TaxID=2903 RepID=A0A0D3IQQ8_EMIH1|nr:hypothetical protein EMIHUDRAFT_212731 [Emiliania huxleyi CCMP1516]EOD13593.1 hypothetical protein EMIHUDRAFT_212731 [Emiliania huxleyi CCMP1516]|eukprot:XP_005766022.1 hypothetical protein EMIHUDRAFT_212731 [Emiliania huxleyi CCMP1516]